MEINNKRRIIEYDVVRLFALMLVIIGHSAYTTMMTSTGGIEINVEYAQIQSYILLFIRLIYSFHMPLFFFLSGAVYSFSRPEKKYQSFWVLLLEKAKKLIIPFLLVNIFYVIPIKFISGYWDSSSNVFLDIFLGEFFFFDNNHLWFCLSLFIIFIIFWLFSKLSRNNTIVLLVLSILLLVASFFIDRNYLGIKKAFEYFFFFDIGFLFDKYRNQISSFVREKKFLVICISTIVVAICYFVYLKFFKSNIFVRTLVSFSDIFFIMCFAILLFNNKDNIHPIFKSVLTLSFFIYLFSDPLNYLILFVLKKSNLYLQYSHNYFCIMIFVFRIIFTFLAAYGLSMLVHFIIKKSKERMSNRKESLS